MQIISECFFIADKIELGESDLKMMLKKHHEKRKRQPVRCQEVFGGGSGLYLLVFYLLAVKFRVFLGDKMMVLFCVCATALQPFIVTCI